MTEFKKFNDLYTSEKAKDLRDQLADLMFNIEYFGFRIQELQNKRLDTTDPFRK